MSSIGDRLRKERERLALNQTQFAELAGTTRKTQFNYETDARKADSDYLAAIAAAGADVLYILTGQRSQPVPAVHLSREELALLDNYKHSDEVGRAAARRLLSPEAQRKKA